MRVNQTTNQSFPRLVAVDLHGAIGQLPGHDAPTNPLYYQQIAQSIDRFSHVRLIDNHTNNPSNDDTKSWTANLSIPYMHDRNAVSIKTVDTEISPFDSFSLGLNAIQESRDLVDRMIDNLRWFAEEADSVSGLQLITDLHDGWGGVAASAIEEIRDEFEHQTVSYQTSFL